MVHRRGAEIPDDRLLAAHQKREAAKLVPFPLADFGRGHVTNVVHVEKEQSPAFRLLKRLSRPFQSVASQSVKIYPTLEVHIHVTGEGMARFHCQCGSASSGRRRCGEGALFKKISSIGRPSLTEPPQAISSISYRDSRSVRS